MKIYALVEYVNRNGKLSIKGFASEAEAESFVSGLAKRNVSYILTVL